MLGHRLLRDHRVTSLDEHLMTTEMDSAKTLRAVAQRAAGGDYGTDVSAMTAAMRMKAARVMRRGAVRRRLVWS